MGEKRTRCWNTAFIILFLAAIFLFSFNPFKESDSFYHIKTGQVIWETHSIPHADIFSYTAPGAPWIVHEWLAEIIFYLIFHFTGFWGVMAFVALLSVATYFFMYQTALLWGSDKYLALFLFVLVGLLTFELWIARPQVFSFLLLSTLVYLLEKYRRTGNKYLLASCLLLLAVWANMHASVILGLAVVFLYAGIEICKVLTSPYRGEGRRGVFSKLPFQLPLGEGESSKGVLFLLATAIAAFFACHEIALLVLFICFSTR